MGQSQTAPRTKAEAAAIQLLITLSGSHSDVVRVETLDKAGKKWDLPDDDFATLIGDQDVEDLLPVLELAYTAGFADASTGVFESEDDEGHGEADQDDIETAVIRGVASQRLIRRGVRKLILARLLKRELLRKRKPAAAAPASKISH
jgi:hypothetical protein